MINASPHHSPHHKDVFQLTFGAVLLLLGLVLLWSWQQALPNPEGSVLGDPFAVALGLASLVAAGWLVFRCWSRGDSAPTALGGLNRSIGTPSEDPAAEGTEREPGSAVDKQTLSVLIRVGGVVLAALLVGLVIGSLVSVVYAFAIAGVAVAFFLIVVLMPRGL